MWSKIGDSIGENAILAFWMLVCLALILLEQHADQWLEVGKYVVGQHLVNSGLNSPLGYGVTSRLISGIGGKGVGQ